MLFIGILKYLLYGLTDLRLVKVKRTSTENGLLMRERQIFGRFFEPFLRPAPGFHPDNSPSYKARTARETTTEKFEKLIDNCLTRKEA